MTRAPREAWSAGVIVVLTVFVAGIVAGWWMRSTIVSPRSFAAAREQTSSSTAAPPPADSLGTAGTRAAAPTDRRPDPAIEVLEARELQLPIENADVAHLRGSFDEVHGGHRHEAVDIPAPRNTPIHAVDDGTIARLFESRAGGHTIYQYDPSGRYCYYYAHLEHYAEGLHEGDRVSRGEVIGYVGTSGNAPRDTPHLHFTIFQLTEDKHWWQGRPIDPYRVFAR